MFRISATFFRTPDLRDLSRQDRLELVGKRILDLPKHLRGDVLHRGHTVGHLRLELFRKDVQDARGLRRVQLRQDQGDRLRVLLADERGDLVRRDVPEQVEAPRGRGRHPVEHRLRPAGAHGLLERPAGEIDPAHRDVLPGHQKRLELLEDLVLLVRRDGPELGDGLGDVLDLVIVQVFQDLRAGVLTERDHQDGHFLAR